MIGNHVARRAQSLQAILWSLLLGADSRGLYCETRCEGRDARFSGEECLYTIMDCCKRRGTAYAPASLRLLPAPEAQRSAPTQAMAA